MNNYCSNCGQKIDSNETICPNCNAEIPAGTIDTYKDKMDLSELRYKEDKYIKMVLSLYVLSRIVGGMSYIIKIDYISLLGPIISFAAYIMLIYARITVRESKKIRIMFLIFIILFIIKIIAFVIIIISCINTLRGCG